MAGMGGATSAGRGGGVRGGRLVRGGVVGLALALGVASGVAAQDPSPSAATEPRLLFIQEFESGTLTPAPQGAGVTVTLEGSTGQTAFATNWPGRQVGVVETSDILTAVAASVNSPPEAVIVGQLADGSQATWTVQILGAQQPSETEIVYDAWLIDTDTTGAFQLASPAPAPSAPVTLGPTQVFIDGLAGMCMRC